MEIKKGDLLFLTDRGIECLGIQEVYTGALSIDETVGAYFFKDQIYVAKYGGQRIPESGIDNRTGLLALTEGALFQVKKDKNLWALQFVTPLDCKLWCLTVQMEDPENRENYISKTPGIRNGKWLERTVNILLNPYGQGK